MKMQVPISLRRGALLFAATALLAFGLAAWAAPRIGRSLVDVALDLAAPLSAPPVVSYGGGASGRTIAMERVPDRFAQTIGAFELKATHRRNPESGG